VPGEGRAGSSGVALGIGSSGAECPRICFVPDPSALAGPPAERQATSTRFSAPRCPDRSSVDRPRGGPHPPLFGDHLERGLSRSNTWDPRSGDRAVGGCRSTRQPTPDVVAEGARSRPLPTNRTDEGANQHGYTSTIASVPMSEMSASPASEKWTVIVASVVVLGHHSAGTLERCLNALALHCSAHPFENHRGTEWIQWRRQRGSRGTFQGESGSRTNAAKHTSGIR